MCDWIQRLRVFRLMFCVFALAALIVTAFSRPMISGRPSPSAYSQTRSQEFVSQEQHKEIEDRLDEQQRRMDTMEARQIEVLTKLASVDTGLRDLKDASDKRQESLTALIVGVAVLLVEMLLRMVLKPRETAKTKAA